MRYIYISILLVVFVYSCKTDTEKSIEISLQFAGDNRPELEYVLDYYTNINPDKEKLKAAKFLISNMRYHASPILVSQEPNLLV